jgi:uncharacterized protein YdaU (DUF1376 family)
MHSYPRHINDFDSATRHLNRIERSVYSDLIDLYYATEKPLTADLAALCRRIVARSNEESTAVEQVLNEFFHQTNDGWWHSRCEAEIEKYRKNNSQKAQAGRASAEAKRLKKEHALNGPSTDVEHPLNSDEHPLERNSTNQKPKTKNQKPVLNTEEANASSPIDPSGQSDPDLPPAEKKTSKPPGLPDCPYTRLLALWAKHLPHLAQPRSWEGNRKTTMRQRWQQAAKPSAYSPKGYATEAEGVGWWDSFFSYIANDTRLSAGFESQNRTWVPDLEWVCNATNFQKIIDGKYAL